MAKEPKDNVPVLEKSPVEKLNALETQSGRQQFIAGRKAQLQAINKQKLSSSMQWALGIIEQELNTQPEKFIAAEQAHLQSVIAAQEVQDGKM